MQVSSLEYKLILLIGSLNLRLNTHTNSGITYRMCGFSRYTQAVQHDSKKAIEE